ncbi:translation initiation factor IF-2 [bacterium]|nr:translation initiation factor IF-2 [bacterium]
MEKENIRVYELAKELGLQNKALIEHMEKLGIKIKSHSSTLTISQVEQIKNSFKPKTEEPAKKPKAFIIKKAAKVQEEPKQEEQAKEEEIKSDEENKPSVSSIHEIIKNNKKVRAEEKKEPETKEEIKEEKAEVKETPEIKKETAEEVKEEAVKEETKAEEEEVKQVKAADIKSLLEYNNRNSQKRRAEMFAEAKRQERKKLQEEQLKKQNEQKAKDEVKNNENKNRNDKFQKPGQRQNVQGQNNQQKPSDRGQGGEKKIQRHIISQDIYDNKGQRNQVGKKKDWDKKKQYKNKEEEQELISLEKAIAQKHKKKSHTDENEVVITQVVISEPITVAALAEKINKTPAEIVKFLMMNGIMSTVNNVIDVETQKKVCANFELEVLDEDLDKYIEEELKKEEKQKELEETDESLLVSRAPVVSIMGHVDHGKTTLLDSIRASKHKIVSTEVGGITQSIGAYTVYQKGKKIVFIDTPGHEAFTEMRARGAKSTDIAILVVAADDGIMPQTIEAINHAKAAEVPIIVAINKMDKETANPDRIMQQLTEYGLVPEEWGGDTVCVKVSALKGDGIDELLEYILLLSEVQNLKANPKARAQGVIIEANLDKGKGPVATLLVQNGTLKTGDCFVVGSVCGRVRALLSDSGERLKEAGPATPVEILGLEEVPQAGDTLEAVENEKVMRAICDERKEKEHLSKLESMIPAHIRNDLAKNNGEDDNIKHLNLIIKANTHGSAEAVSQGVAQLESKEIVIKIIHVGVGDVSEADVKLANASNAIILGFGVKEDTNAQLIAEKEGVTIKKYNIIYQVLEDIEHTMLKLLEPEIKEVALGVAEVRQIFTIGKVNKIAGCYVTEGKVVRNKTAVVERDGIEIFRGQIDQLKRFKDDAKEVQQGFECGISFAKFNDLKEGDIIRVSTTEEVERQVLV